jgi:hypothetical protein
VLSIIAIPLSFSTAEGIGLRLGYVVAGVFFPDFFKIWPFRA